MEKLNRDFFGEKNPNYKNSGNKICICCGNSYQSYSKTRKYCAHSCYVKDQKERIVQSASIAAKAPRKKREKLGYKLNCKFCNFAFRSLTRKFYCEDHKFEARKAQSQSKGRKIDATKHVTANCLFCKKEFQFYKSSPRQYCSYKCHLDNGGAWKAGLAAVKATMKYGAKKDANHKEIVQALTDVGAYVLDMSHVGSGFPDLIIGFQQKTLLVEIKNPKTAYGKRGLNKNQLKWRDSWTGGSYFIVDSVDSALQALGIKDDT